MLYGPLFYVIDKLFTSVKVLYFLLLYFILFLVILVCVY
jgi:hypothetical protein